MSHISESLGWKFNLHFVAVTLVSLKEILISKIVFRARCSYKCTPVSLPDSLFKWSTQLEENQIENSDAYSWVPNRMGLSNKRVGGWSWKWV